MNPPITAISIEWFFLKDAPACPMFDQFVSHLIDSGYVPVRFIGTRYFCRLPMDVNHPQWNKVVDVIWIKSHKLTSKLKRMFGFGTVREWMCML